MNLKELRDRFRKRADDESQPYFWSDDNVDAKLNDAVAEAAVRARLIFDEGTPICQIPIVYGQAVYQCDPSIYEIMDAYIVSSEQSDPNNGRQLILTSQTTLDEQNGMNVRRSFGNSAIRSFYQNTLPYWAGGNWRTWKGQPRYLIQDQSRLQLVPQPVSAGTQTLTLNIAVYRTPLCSEQMKSPKDCPVIPSHWHERLVDWPLYRAFADKDSQRNDDVRSAAALAAFESSFGKRQDANVIRKQNERRRRTVSSVWP